jgi:hypothetical protein
MAEPITEAQVQGLKHFKRLSPLLAGLRPVGCERDRAGNRTLFFDDYCKLVLLYLFNPLIDSIQALQAAAALPKVAKTLGVKRFSAGSFSESVRVFEPDRLKAVIGELAGELRPLGKDPRLSDLKHVLTMVDGTVLTALTRLAAAAVGRNGDTRYTTVRDGAAGRRPVHGWRLHTQFDLQTFCPHRVERTGARNGGATRENRVLRRSLEPGRCYVGDGGFADRVLFDGIVAAGSSYVIRVQENSTFTVTEERLLSQAALDAGVVRDAVVTLVGADGHRHGRAGYAGPVRMVELQVEPHPRRSRSGTRQSDRLLIASNLLDLPAELVALIYRYRYTVELFFRFLKHILGLRHLLSQRGEGVDTQVYCAVIACMLINLQTGKRPDKATVRMLGWYLIGLASEQDVRAFLDRPDNRGVKRRAKDELWKKLGY